MSPGQGFRAIGELLGSGVEYVRGDVFTVADTGERFDVILSFGILHRVENPLGLLQTLRGLPAPGGPLLVETYGMTDDHRPEDRTIEVRSPGDVYPGDDCVYWGFGAGGLCALATHAGFTGTRIDGTPVIDGHPRILATLERSERRSGRPRAGRKGGSAQGVRPVADHRVAPSAELTLYRHEVLDKENIAELHRRTDPEQMARHLSQRARKRGL